MTTLRHGDELREVSVEQKGGGALVVRVGETAYAVKVVRCEGAHVELEFDDGRRVRALAARDKRGVYVHSGGRAFTFVREEPAAGKRRGRGGHEPGLEAPMPGQIRAVAAVLGAEVAEGDTLVVLEAMKMELRIRAPHAGRVTRVSCQVGDVVDRGQVLVELGASE